MKVIHKDNPDFQTEEYRKIFLDGTHNTRELGGYKTTDGKKSDGGSYIGLINYLTSQQMIRNTYHRWALKMLSTSGQAMRNLRTQT